MKYILFAPILVFLLDSVIVYLNIIHKKNLSIPEELFDEKDFNQFRSYGVEKSMNKLIQLFIRIIYLVFCVLYLFDKIYDFLNTQLTSNTLIIILIYVALYTIYQILESLYEGFDMFFTETKYGFNKTKLTRFVLDQLIDYVFTVLILGLVIYAQYSLYLKTSSTYVIYGFIIIVILIVLYHSLFVVIAIPFLYKLRPLGNEELRNKIKEMGEREGFDIDEVYVINASERTTKMDAYFSGFGKSKKVMLFDTLLNEFTDDQLLSIIAHEIGHSVNKDMIKDLIKGVVIAFVYFATFYLLLQKHSFELSLLYLIILISPINFITKIISNILNRKSEKNADFYAARMGYSKQMAYCLEKAAKKNKGNLFPHKLFEFTKFSHPSYQSRLDYLREFEIKNE